MMRSARPLSESRFYGGAGTLGSLRNLANTLKDGAFLKHLEGDDAEAIERLRDILHIGRSLGQDDWLIAQLVAIGIDALAARGVLVAAPGLRLDSQPVQVATRALIEDLLDDRSPGERMRRAVIYERLLHEQEMRRMSAGTWIMRPLADREIVIAIADSFIFQDAAAAGNEETSLQILQRRRARGKPGLDDGTWVTAGARYSLWYADSWDLSRAISQQYRISGERRAAAVSLAAQLYRFDHSRWPENSDQLVPDYLAKLPADPFHADGRPIGYVLTKGALPDGGDRPRVFFDVGTSDELLSHPEPIYQWTQSAISRKVVPRQYRDLARWLPARRQFESPSTQAVEDDPPQANAPGDDAKKDNNAQN
jgi:hypothetical protein